MTMHITPQQRLRRRCMLPRQHQIEEPEEGDPGTLRDVQMTQRLAQSRQIVDASVVEVAAGTQLQLLQA